MWVAFKDGVYDITDFYLYGGHPGGLPPLRQAAGGHLEPFWSVYRFHYEEK